ncbi:hypothetical protein [Rathayibacter rathayi]|uniref:hypothetical protein n=1 Tax=Rathayibacter rathayi TaxID=33887 RepID=UPI000CE8DCFC|nr:hypothetical protein [Rathayibacter rathayi]PPG70232.1 hypothetical protein C5C02_04820 [Rathayibacter rathayi]PPG78082.1 hypothetical protein C5C23_03345 [Rathayibacter rathayi]PPI77616.1 hypothetical protein C5E03_04005 [Rathayibacter rathayi]
MSIRSTSVPAIAVAVALALAGCGTAGVDPTPSTSPSPSAAPSAPAAQSSSDPGSDLNDPETLKKIAGALGGASAFSFEAGAAFSPDNTAYWNLDQAALTAAGFRAVDSGTDPSTGHWLFRDDAGTTLLVIQQRVRDNDPAVSDEDATRHVIEMSRPLSDLQPTSLAFDGGGTVDALRADIASDDDLTWTTVARTFTQTGIALSLIAAGEDQARASAALDVGIHSTTVDFRGVLPLVGGSSTTPPAE